VTEIVRALARSTRAFKAEFPDYAALSNPEPLSVAQVQADLRPHEALVLFLDTPKMGSDTGGDVHLGRDQGNVRWGAK